MVGRNNGLPGASSAEDRYVPLNLCDAGAGHGKSASDHVILLLATGVSEEGERCIRDVKASGRGRENGADD